MPEDLLRVDDSIRQIRVYKLKKVKAERNREKAKDFLARLESEAKTDTNLMPAIVDACENYVSLGERSDTFSRVFGT